MRFRDWSSMKCLHSAVSVRPETQQAPGRSDPSSALPQPESVPAPSIRSSVAATGTLPQLREDRSQQPEPGLSTDRGKVRSELPTRPVDSGPGQEPAARLPEQELVVPWTGQESV